MDLKNWKGAPRPERVVLDGRYARLEPFDPVRHAEGLLASSQAPGAEDRFRYIWETAPKDMADLKLWLDKAAVTEDPLFFAVIDKATGKVEGRQAYLRIDPANGVIEIGHIHWGPAIARSRVTTEANYLFATYAFDTLGYRRYEWKLHNHNEPSHRAARRFGFTFEGVFRQHMIMKGESRDTAWYAMIDADWPRLKAEYERWLSPDNFDAAGQQKTKLRFD